MFTGIIEETGRLQTVSRSASSSRIVIGARKIIEDMNTGDSISVNGVCLTVTGFTSAAFTADVMNETWIRCALGLLKPGALVNLERAMPANGRFGGHIVSGHVDGTGTIMNIKSDGNAYWYDIHTSDAILQYVIEKGSIAIDGISLTVAAVLPDRFSVSVIPHTRENTALHLKQTGDQVNLENDCIGKYIRKLLKPHDNQSVITRDFLSRHGF